MKATVSFSYGTATYKFEFEEANDKETLLKTLVLGNPPRNCKLIRDPNALYKLEAKEVSGKHIYIEAVCIGKVNGVLKVAKSQLGTYESTKGYFWKTWEFDEFANKRLGEPEGGQETQPAQTQAPAPAPTTPVAATAAAPTIDDELEDLPF